VGVARRRVLAQFSTLKTLKASRNEIAEVTIERLPRLKYLDLSHNRLDGIPDLSGFKALSHLNLSHNLIGSRPDSETSKDGWENFKNSSLQQLTHFDLSYNKLDWDQKTFNEQVRPTSSLPSHAMPPHPIPPLPVSSGLLSPPPSTHR
jgi:Leucine-rich repeat (LRR) protein